MELCEELSLAGSLSEPGQTQDTRLLRLAINGKIQSPLMPPLEVSWAVLGPLSKPKLSPQLPTCTVQPEPGHEVKLDVNSCSGALVSGAADVFLIHLDNVDTNP